MDLSGGLRTSSAVQCVWARAPPVSRMKKFIPHLEILTPGQRLLWHELDQIPAEFTLYGGTAVALHLGHRQSVDFDFFGKRPFDPAKLQASIPFLADAQVVQRERNTLTAIVNREGAVTVSFFGVPNLPRLAPPLVSDGNGLKVASLLDLAGTKASVVQDIRRHRFRCGILETLSGPTWRLLHGLMRTAIPVSCDGYLSLDEERRNARTARSRTREQASSSESLEETPASARGMAR